MGDAKGLLPWTSSLLAAMVVAVRRRLCQAASLGSRQVTGVGSGGIVHVRKQARFLVHGGGAWRIPSCIERGWIFELPSREGRAMGHPVMNRKPTLVRDQRCAVQPDWPALLSSCSASPSRSPLARSANETRSGLDQTRSTLRWVADLSNALEAWKRRSEAPRAPTRPIACLRRSDTPMRCARRFDAATRRFRFLGQPIERPRRFRRANRTRRKSRRSGDSSRTPHGPGDRAAEEHRARKHAPYAPAMWCTRLQVTRSSRR